MTTMPPTPHPQEGKTPRTDAVINRPGNSLRGIVPADFARQLETELNAADEKMNELVRNGLERQDALETQLAASKARIEALTKTLDRVHALLNAMPDAPTATTDMAFDKWRLWTDAVNICKSDLLTPTPPQD